MPRLKAKKSPPDPYQPVVDTIWRYAREYGVTQTANAIGVSSNWLHRRRRNPKMLRLQDIDALARVLDIPGEELHDALPW